MSASPVEDPNHSSFSFEDSPTLFLFTSLTAGSSHVITATSRLETILKANRIPFRAIDTATNEKARRIWGRRAGKKKLPGLVREGWILADLEEVEEWNEYGELKEQLANASGVSGESGPTTGISTPVTGAPAQGLPSQHHLDGIKTTGITTTLPIREQVPKRDSGVIPPVTTTESEKPSSPATAVRINTTSPVPSRDADDIVSPSEARSPHNTSYITGLPPLRIPSGASTPSAVKQQPDPLKSPNVPDPPPPSAMPGATLDLSTSHGLPSGAPSDHAGPASKSGLDAVTSDPLNSDAAVAAQQTAAMGERGRQLDRDNKPSLSTASTMEEGNEEQLEQPPSHDKGPGLKVKFTEAQLKGDAKNGSKASESVED